MQIAEIERNIDLLQQDPEAVAKPAEQILSLGEAILEQWLSRMARSQHRKFAKVSGYWHCTDKEQREIRRSMPAEKHAGSSFSS